MKNACNQPIKSWSEIPEQKVWINRRQFFLIKRYKVVGLRSNSFWNSQTSTIQFDDNSTENARAVYIFKAIIMVILIVE